MIRGKIHPCPFGLPIPSACKQVGQNINEMSPLEEAEEEDRPTIKEDNQMLLFDAEEDCGKCPFAASIIKEKGSVDCRYGETRPSGDVAFSGSPLYPHTYVGEMAKPLYSNFPEHEYKDDNIHNTYLGLLSFYG